MKTKSLFPLLGFFLLFAIPNLTKAQAPVSDTQDGVTQTPFSDDESYQEPLPKQTPRKSSRRINTKSFINIDNHKPIN